MSKQNNSETNRQEPEPSSLRSATTTVKTAYARAALLLLACNMLLTGYAVVAFQKAAVARAEQIDGTAPVAAQQLRTAQPTSGEQGETTPSTREIETPTGATEDNR